MKSFFRFFAILISVAVIGTGSALSQEIKIERQVIGSGGVVGAVNSEGTTMSGILGQAAIETVSDAAILVEQGFWSNGDKGTGVEDIENIELSANLTNYPNPMSTSTTIKYTLPSSGFVTIRIYDMMGRIVKELVGEVQASGDQAVVWDGIADDGQAVPAGTYMYEMVMQSGQAGPSANSVRDRNMLVVVR